MGVLTVYNCFIVQLTIRSVFMHFLCVVFINEPMSTTLKSSFPFKVLVQA